MVLLLMQMPVWLTVSLLSFLKKMRSPAFKSSMEEMRVQELFLA